MKRQNLLAAAALVLVLTTVGLTGCSPGAAGASALETVNVSAQQEGIWVTGQGKVTAAPDIATVRLGIEVQRTSVAEAQAQANEAMGEVEAALTAAGIARKDIQTQVFSIRQVTRWDRDTETEVVIGFRVSNQVAAKVRNIDDVGQVIDSVIAAGGDFIRISGISFSVDDLTPLQEEARELAMTDARDKAQQLARLAGVSLGQPTFISEGGSGIPTPYPVEVAVRSFAESAEGISISPGELEVVLNVQVGYSIR